MTDSDPLKAFYTLREARQLIAAENCARWGHTWEHVTNATRILIIRVDCTDCGAAYTCTPSGNDTTVEQDNPRPRPIETERHTR